MRTELVHIALAPAKCEELEAFAKERGCTIDELVSEAVTEFLREKRSKLDRDRIASEK